MHATGSDSSNSVPKVIEPWQHRRGDERVGTGLNHDLSRIQMVGLSLTQPILSYREKRQGLPTAFWLEVGGGLELLKLMGSLSVVAKQNIQNVLT